MNVKLSIKDITTIYGENGELDINYDKERLGIIIKELDGRIKNHMEKNESAEAMELMHVSGKITYAFQNFKTRTKRKK